MTVTFLIFAVVLLCIGTSVSSQTVCGSKSTPTCYDQQAAGGDSCYSGAITNLQDCDYIQGSEIHIYVGSGTGTAASPEVISFKATSIDGPITVYGTFGMSVALQFDSLQTLNGTLTFDASFGSSSLSMKSLNCWHSGSSNVDTSVTPGSWVNTTTIGDSVSGGTTIVGSFSISPTYPQSINIGQIAGVISLATQQYSSEVTFPKLTYLGGLNTGTQSSASYNMPALKSVGQISVGTQAYLNKFDAPALELFNPGNEAINNTAVAAFYVGTQATVSNVKLGTYTVTSSDSCNCASPASGFNGCTALCSSTYKAAEPSCSLNSVPDIAALIMAILMAIGVVVAIVIGSCIFCCCIIGGGYWASQQRKKLSSQDAQRAQNAVEVTNPVGLAPPPGMGKDVVPAPSSNAV